MTPIDFGVTSSKVKVTATLNVKMVSADYLENYISHMSSYFTCRLAITSKCPLLILESLGLKVQVTVTLNAKMVSTDYLEYCISQSSYFTCRLVMTSR